MGVPRAVRKDDERVLAMLSARCRMSSGDVGLMFGVTGTAVRVVVNRVIQADLADSGEAREVVLAGYAFHDGRLE